MIARLKMQVSAGVRAEKARAEVKYRSENVWRSYEARSNARKKRKRANLCHF